MMTVMLPRSHVLGRSSKGRELSVCYSTAGCVFARLAACQSITIHMNKDPEVRYTWLTL